MDSHMECGFPSVQQETGAVTVFLTLVFSLIFSLTMVSLEAARSAAMRAFAQILLDAASESVAADFYRPLFDEYHLFGLDTGYGEKAGSLAKVAEDVDSRYSHNIWGLIPYGSVIEKSEPFLDPEAAVFSKQAAKYEMIGAAKGALSALGEKLGIISGQDQSARILQKKLDAESKFAKIDELTLELMKHVDGINCNISDSKGVRFTTENRFVKRLMNGNVSAYSAGINNADVFTRINDKMCDLQDSIDTLKSAVMEYAEGRQAEEMIEELLSETEDRDTRRMLRAELNNRTKETDKAYDICRKISEQLREACSDSEKKTEDALECLDRIMAAEKEAEPGVKEYEDLILESGDLISEEERMRHMDSLDMMKRYLGEGPAGLGADYDVARHCLENNRSLLESSGYSHRLRFSRMPSQEAYEWADELSELEYDLSGICYEGLAFDYSSFSAKKEDVGTDPVFCRNLIDNLEGGLLKLILGEEAVISEEEIDTALLPGNLLETMEEDARNRTEGFPKSQDEYDGGQEMSGVIGSSALDEVSALDCEELNETENEETADEKETANAGAWKKSLVILYLHDSFADYTDPEKADDTVLKYEQEYIICGKNTDRDNLSVFLTELLLMRLVSSILYAMSDRDVTMKAESAATLAAGFTGMPYLIKAVQYLILFIWAYEQAVIEVAALAMGRKIPVMTDRDSFCLDIKELVSFSSSMVRNKAENLPEPVRGIGYGEYLMIFMMIQKHRAACYRAMDLIQENIRYEYDEDFLLANCIDSFTAGTTFEISFRFIGFGGYEVKAVHSVRY